MTVGVDIELVEPARRWSAQTAPLEIERRGVTGAVEIAGLLVPVDAAAEMGADGGKGADRCDLGRSNHPAGPQRDVIEAQPGVVALADRGHPHRFPRLDLVIARDAQRLRRAADRGALERPGQKAEAG